MGSAEVSSLKRLYHEPYDFTLSVHEDVDTFLNVKEFAAIHDIDGAKVPCVVTASKVRGTNYDGAITRGLVLWIRNEHVNRAESGMTVRIDGAQYVVSEARKLQGEMWRIELGVYDG